MAAIDLSISTSVAPTGAPTPVAELKDRNSAILPVISGGNRRIGTNA